MKIKKYDAQVNVSMDSDLKKRLEDVSARAGKSMSEFAREAIADKLRSTKKELKK